MMKQFYHCGLYHYQYQRMIVGTHLQLKMVWSPLIATWRVYRLLQAITSRFTALQQISSAHSKILSLGDPTLKCCFRGTHNSGKDLLTNRKDPWAELKDLKGLFIENSISKDLKGPKSTMGTLFSGTDLEMSQVSGSQPEAHADPSLCSSDLLTSAVSSRRWYTWFEAHLLQRVAELTQSGPPPSPHPPKNKKTTSFSPKYIMWRRY